MVPGRSFKLPTYNHQVTFLKFIITFTITIVALVASGISPLNQPTNIISPTFQLFKLILFESDALLYIYRTHVEYYLKRIVE